MEQRPDKGLTVIQWLLLVALLGIVLTFLASIWSGPETSSVETEAQRGVADSQ
jgi:hypothetical protein